MASDSLAEIIADLRLDADLAEVEGCHFSTLFNYTSRLEHLSCTILDALTALEADKAALVEALLSVNAHIERMQSHVRAYLPPDSGLSEHDLANSLIECLDGPDQRRLQGKIDAALAKHGGSNDAL